MIEGLRGAAALKELTTIAQNLEKKLGLPVSVEALQKLLETKDGYKYLANIDGKLTEILSKKELETGVKYWADGVKNQLSNTLTLENLVQKPHILQSDIFKSDTLSKALGFEKLVEAVKAESAKTLPQSQKSTDAKPTPTPTQQTAVQPEANKNAPNTIRLAAAETELSKTQTTNVSQTPQNPQGATETPKKSEHSPADIKKDSQKIESQKIESKEPKVPKTESMSAKDVVAKELKGAILSLFLEIKERTKEDAKLPKTSNFDHTPKAEPQKEIATAKTSQKLSGDTLADKLREFKNIMASSPNIPSKAEMEKAKIEASELKRELRSIQQTAVIEHAKLESVALSVLSQNFELLGHGALEEAAKKIIDALFGKSADFDGDEVALKILEHLQKQLDEREAKSEPKKKAKLSTEVGDDEGGTKKPDEDSAKTIDKESKSENPASKVKAQLLEEMAKVVTKSDFQILSQVAMALNKEVFTFVLEDKGVLQFKKRGDGELNAKWIEFYSAFETLGPVSGEIAYIDGHTSLYLNVEFESTYNFLKENLKELSFFDHKNVSIMHGIKEIVEIRSSFLDTTG